MNAEQALPLVSPWLFNQAMEIYSQFSDPLEDKPAPVRAWPQEREALLIRIEQLERELGVKEEIPAALGIPRNMSALMGILLKREIVTRDGALIAIYSGMPNTWDKEPDPKIIDVFVCKLRVRLRKYGVKVSCKWGLGYFIDGENKRKLRDLIARTRADAAA